MRDAVRNKKGWKRRRTPTQDPSTDLRGHRRRYAHKCDANWGTDCAGPGLPITTPRAGRLGGV